MGSGTPHQLRAALMTGPWQLGGPRVTWTIDLIGLMRCREVRCHRTERPAAGSPRQKVSFCHYGVIFAFTRTMACSLMNHYSISEHPEWGFKGAR